MIIQLDNTLISSEIFSTYFVCHLDKCKGSCCIEGDRGAPLEKEELNAIHNNLEHVKPYMTQKGIELLNSQGFYEGDDDDLATTCLPTGECVFAYQESGILGCAIEKSFKNNQSNFYKPISCHLYPIRLGKSGENDTVNYHYWEICKAACALGEELKVPVFQFLKEPLIRKYGEAWYNELQNIYQEYIKQFKSNL